MSSQEQTVIVSHKTDILLVLCDELNTMLEYYSHPDGLRFDTNHDEEAGFWAVVVSESAWDAAGRYDNALAERVEAFVDGFMAAIKATE